MDDHWLSNLEQSSALLVPTRSLANELSERVARINASQGRSVWVAPNILVWSDYLRLLWQHNRERFAELSLISQSQATLLWTQIIETTRKQDNLLALLNVQQTMSAVQRSWKLMHEWCVEANQLRSDHVADSEQFVSWTEAYENLLTKRSLIDESQLLKSISTQTGELAYPFRKLIFVSYDLINNAQQKHLELARNAGVDISFQRPTHSPDSEKFYRYVDTRDEITAALKQARKHLERDPTHTISLVIPDLQHRQNQVQALAREVFYAAESPAHVLNNNAVYRFSLGRPLTEMAPIVSALGVIALLKNKTSVLDFGSILRSRYLNFCTEHSDEIYQFEQWLMQQRLRLLLFDQLPSLYQQCLDALNKYEKTNQFCCTVVCGVGRGV